MNSAALPAQIGKYWVKRLLGTGGMGRVFLAVDPDIGREVAIKLVTLGSDPQASERFLREAQTMGRLNHPNIVTLLEFGVDQQSPFLVLEFLSGEDLSQWMLRPHSLREQVQAMTDVAQAIAAAHKVGVLHRDLKPENVRVLDDGRCKLLDFGIAQSGAGQLTASGYFVGTPEFVAPEVMSGSAHTAAADIYALGLLFYTMLCGSNPFRGDNVQATVARVVQLEPVSLDKRLNGVPVELAALIHRCLSKQPELRPPSADSLVQALTAELARISPDTRLRELPPPSNTAPVPITPAPSKTQTAAAVDVPIATPRATRWGALATLLLLGAASAWWWLQPAPDAPSPASIEPAAPAQPSAVGVIDAPQVAASTPPDPVPAAAAASPIAAEPSAAEAPGPAKVEIDVPLPAATARPVTTDRNTVDAHPDPLPAPPPSASAGAIPPAEEPGAQVPVTAATESQPTPSPENAIAPTALADSPPEAASSPEPAAPVQVQVSRFSPRTLRAGRNVTMRLEGSGLDSVDAVVVNVGAAPDPRFRVGALTHAGDSRLEFNLGVARGVPLGSYALILQGKNLRAAPVLLEVSL